MISQREKKQSPFALAILARISLISLLILLLAHCDRAVKPPSAEEAKRLIEDTFGKLVSANTQNPPSHLPQIEVFIDGSGSMSGFIRAKSKERTGYLIGQTTYASSLMNLRAVLSSIGSRALFYKFGADEQGVAEAVNEPTQAINRESFYNQSDTRLGPLIRRFSERPDEELPEVFIVITDGVQSTPQGSDFTEVISSVSRWLSKGFNFEILAFRSEFNGDVYSDLLRLSGQGHKIGWYSGERPFYWYIFSVKPDFGKKLDALLRERYTIDSKYLNFSSDAFDNAKVQLEIPSRTSGAEATPFGIRTKSPESDIIFLYWRDTHEARLTGRVRAKLQLKVKEEFRDFQINLKDFKLKVDGLNCKTGAKIEPEINLDDIQIAANSSESRAFDYEISCNEIKQPDWTASRVSLFPQDTTFRPPQWVSDWSTDHDTSTADFSNTLFFREFITSIMLKARFKDQPLVTFYILIKGRGK